MMIQARSCNRVAHRIFLPPGQIRRNFACWVPLSREEMTLYSVLVDSVTLIPVGILRVSRMNDKPSRSAGLSKMAP
jgi:hypothetical protein